MAKADQEFEELVERKMFELPGEMRLNLDRMLRESDAVVVEDKAGRLATISALTA